MHAVKCWTSVWCMNKPQLSYLQNKYKSTYCVGELFYYRDKTDDVWNLKEKKFDLTHVFRRFQSTVGWLHGRGILQETCPFCGSQEAEWTSYRERNVLETWHSLPDYVPLLTACLTVNSKTDECTLKLAPSWADHPDTVAAEHCCTGDQALSAWVSGGHFRSKR